MPPRKRQRTGRQVNPQPPVPPPPPAPLLTIPLELRLEIYKHYNDDHDRVEILPKGARGCTVVTPHALGYVCRQTREELTQPVCWTPDLAHTHFAVVKDFNFAHVIAHLKGLKARGRPLAYFNRKLRLTDDDDDETPHPERRNLTLELSFSGGWFENSKYDSLKRWFKYVDVELLKGDEKVEPIEYKFSADIEDEEWAALRTELRTHTRGKKNSEGWARIRKFFLLYDEHGTMEKYAAHLKEKERFENIKNGTYEGDIYEDDIPEVVEQMDREEFYSPKRKYKVW